VGAASHGVILSSGGHQIATPTATPTPAPLDRNSFSDALSVHRLSFERREKPPGFTVAEYCLNYIMKWDWTTLGPKIAGKLHLDVGDIDAGISTTPCT